MLIKMYQSYVYNTRDHTYRSVMHILLKTYINCLLCLIEIDWATRSKIFSTNTFDFVGLTKCS